MLCRIPFPNIGSEGSSPDFLGSSHLPTGQPLSVGSLTEQKKRTLLQPKENLLENFSGLEEKLSSPAVDTKISIKLVRVNFWLLPSDTSWEPNRNCSEKLVQMNFFILGGFFGWIFIQQHPSPGMTYFLQI